MDNTEHGRKKDVRAFSLSPFAGRGIKGEGHEPRDYPVKKPPAAFVIPAPLSIPAQAGIQKTPRHPGAGRGPRPSLRRNDKFNRRPRCARYV
ncbi:MAG: hypothetical protein KA099_04355 [Alphaproteobacteria bacterium]|nr:hypothetical protein [Alphaproteobacteria bacterium]MBP7759063.1 hypothetical protein [Alphaproteobacteria bacterium]MBP7762427.1 hypothetical protein [Alphaproteobacteria bacterium]MBP7904540.1 hypothetical protein [Alphaproteobacteria bacterium]